jgi:hypothetical protein
MNRRAILEEVAAGRLSPADAASLLDAPAGGARSVRLRSAYQAVDVVADPTVAELLVEGGTHRVRREGDMLVVTDSPPQGFHFVSRAGTRRLAVRANPRLELDAEVTGAVFSVWGMNGAVRAVVQAGSARIERATGPLDLRLISGAAIVTGAPRGGDWRLRSESGSLELVLDADADATVAVTDRHSHVDVLGAGRHARLGSGTHAIDIEAAFSDVVVRMP